MNKIKAVIIEDEFPAARLLNKMIQKVRPEWEVTVLPGTIEGAVSWFNENPQLLDFLASEITIPLKIIPLQIIKIAPSKSLRNSLTS